MQFSVKKPCGLVVNVAFSKIVGKAGYGDDNGK